MLDQNIVNVNPKIEIQIYNLNDYINYINYSNYKYKNNYIMTTEKNDENTKITVLNKDKEYDEIVNKYNIKNVFIFYLNYNNTFIYKS